MLPPSPPLQPQPPLPPYYTTDNNNLEISMYLEEQEMRRFDAYWRYILRRRTHKRAKEKKKAAVAASLPTSPLAATAQPPQGPPPKPIALPGAVASDAENCELSIAMEKMNALGESSGKKILEGDGPEGKKVDGFLYKHDKGDHIFILCFRHSVFLSPTDFVKHANRIDWSNPMKHITVTSPPPV
ncbi:hypothetical protein NL676_029139 [Syzygium grande]|nr:hypothetical protein NL676_029139 [Syzygium grande]